MNISGIWWASMGRVRRGGRASAPPYLLHIWAGYGGTGQPGRLRRRLGHFFLPVSDWRSARAFVVCLRRPAVDALRSLQITN